MRLTALAMAIVLAAGPALAADDSPALRAELRRLSERVDTLEKQNQEMEKSLASERLSENEPEIITRLKAVEFQTLSMQKQARQIEALEGITVGGSLTGVLQQANGAGAASGARETRANYRGDVSVTLPGGEIGDIEGKIFGHFRFGQGEGVALRPTYTSTPNTTAFQVAGVPADDSFGILAQAWYKFKVPLPRGGVAAQSKEHLHLTAGKIDPFVFFDQNLAADDESARFMNNALVHNPLLDSGGDVGADAYGFAPGAIAQYVNEREKGSEWSLSLGVFGAGPGANFSGSPGRPFVIAQAETAARLNYLPGNYRLYAWTNGRGLDWNGQPRRHGGVGVSVDQQVDDDVTLFARYGQQRQGEGRFDRTLTVGSEFRGGGWGRAADALGVAVGALATSAGYRDGSLATDGYAASGAERLAELYYRYRLNNHVELTPDLQLLRRPGGDAAVSTVRVAGLRAKIGF